MNRRNVLAVTVAAVLGAGSLAAGLATNLGGGTATRTQALGPVGAKASYTYYLALAKGYAGQPGPGYGSMMGPGHGSVMGSGGYGWMMGRSGYSWMMGGSGAPGWMMGGSLPASMMGGSHDMGKVMGRLFADAPGPRVSPSQESQLAGEVPDGATVNKAANTLTFAGHSVAFAVIASPSMPAENFEVAGLTNPTIVVPEGAHVVVEVVNADPDMAHGFVVAAQGAQKSVTPMMTAAPAFSSAALWFLGATTAAGMHAGTVSFTASAAGNYSYFCPVPGHAQEGMVGSFVVQSTPAS